jgi:hypothetical protein
MLPVLLIWNLKISKRQKTGLCAIFGVGLITCICGILRTFYATKLYFCKTSIHQHRESSRTDFDDLVTYDITWAAYSGWIWTTLEAQLAVICASAPSLKVFFNRYFGTYTTRAGYSQTGTPNKTSGPLSHTKSLDFNTKVSQHSVQRSQCTAGSIRGDVPLEGIHINRKLDVKVEERDDCSQVSFASTKGLTALPMPTQPGWRGRSDWVDGCRAVCAALRPESRGTSENRSRTREDDVEAGRAF